MDTIKSPAHSTYEDHAASRLKPHAASPLGETSPPEPRKKKRRDIRQCIYCNREKLWAWNDQKLKDGSKIYVDQTGRRWAGRRCPDCERSRVHAAVRCDAFERDIIIRQLESAGYTPISRTLPLKVRSKDGDVKKVGVKRAYTENGKIVVESPVDPHHDIYALVFESVRICTGDQMEKLSPNIGIHPSNSENAARRQGGSSSSQT